MPTFTFSVDSLEARASGKSIEVTVEDSIGDIVNGAGEEELLDYIGKEAAIKYFDIEEAQGE